MIHSVQPCEAIHQAKWMSLRICYNDHMKQQDWTLNELSFMNLESEIHW